ncbi:DUF4179 domain-containing protein [Bacillus sp. ISL-47]|uniref:DUF4179 domain-containing protein n=1 Tax=Bacillus sp. ISL-47 TaxID=2819130 RepID=UPI001BE8B309|nr:DUF4179 domain-containing protein [Bacillus sp. ISL-47]MBT2687487.1 DUF4179 domain-containing protein [Bacillus sp. ISL-47]MBT2706517.1 DUF4179 domain-containing protein [Pseudomonas sp. ISL-84]
MYEKEEQDLAKMKKSFDEITISEEKIDAAILAGFQKAKREGAPAESASIKKQPGLRRKRWILPSVAAAVLAIVFLTSIRVSPAFAHYVAELPGMQKIVEIIRFDKGLMSAVENDYLQKIGVTQEKNGLRVTIDSVIADETGLVIFYTMESEKKQKLFDVEEMELEPADGTKFVLGSSSYGTHSPYDDKPRKSVSSALELFFQEKLETKKFNLSMKVKTDDLNETFQIPFSIEKPVKVKKTYEMNKEVTIEGQKITVKDITVYPLRVAVHLAYDPNNSKKIFEFQDIRLVDENGESWTKISNGITASHVSDHEDILYLQSNYFKEPKQLYLVMNKIQAVDKDEAYVLVDTDKKEILKQPKGSKLSCVEWEDDMLMFTLDTKEDFHYFLFNSVKDANNKDIYDGMSTSYREEGGKQKIGISLPSREETDYKNPLRLELSFFPAWIEGDVKMKVK